MAINSTTLAYGVGVGVNNVTFVPSATVIQRNIVIIGSSTTATNGNYINLAANEAEKAAQVSLNHLSSVGVFGRIWMSGSESEIMAARNAAVNAISSVTGRPAA